MTESRYRDFQMKASQTVCNVYSFIEESGMYEEEANFFISLIMQKLSNDLVHSLFKKEDVKND